MSQAHEAHGADDGHGHSPFIQHHYDDAQHQFDAGKLGIWIFLAQEVLFFSGLFVAYVLYRVHHPEIFSYAHKYLQVKFGAINTAVLIFSSLTAAWAVRCAQLNQRRGLIACLTVTLLCACTFLGIKYIEYSHKVHEHILFGRYFDPCVSSGGNELLTKNNECPGSKSTVKWNTGTAKPDAGCFDDDAFDQNPHAPGVQADCAVDEVTVELYKQPILTTGASHDCTKTPFAAVKSSGQSYTFTGTCDTIQVLGDNNKLTFDKAKKISVDGANNTITAQGVDALELYSKPPPADKPADPTVKPVAPPEVLNIQQGISAPKPAQTITVGVLEADVADHERELKRQPIKKQCPEEVPGVETPEASPKAFPCWEVAVQPAVCGKVDAGMASRNLIKHIGEFGVLVLYDDTEERGDTIRIDAVCKPAPKAVEVADVYADKEQRIQLGEKELDASHQMTEHEMTEREHEIEAAGPPPEHTGMFLSIYFAMTGLHGLHVLIGVVIFIWLLIRAVKGQFTPDYFGPVDFAALYWHIVDLIWIFLFPLLYLIH